MKRCVVIVWALAVGPLCAQSIETTDNGAAYARIEAERARETSALNEQEAACYQRFLVSSCLKTVQAKRVVVMRDLRRQETALHDTERRQQGSVALQRLDEKAKDKLEKDGQTEKDTDAVGAADRIQAQKDKHAEHAARAKVPSASDPAQHENTAPSAQEQAKNRENYANKLADAEQRRQSIAKQRADKTGKPLPDPQNPD